MKKIITIIAALTMVLTLSLSVSAQELDQDFVSNMDAETYLSHRLEQIQDALDNKVITPEEAASLVAHVTEVAETGAFGNGPSFGVKGDGNATCILGEDSRTCIFRSPSAGMRTGSGNGVKRQLADGSGSGNGNRGANGGGRNRQ